MRSIWRQLAASAAVPGRAPDAPAGARAAGPSDTAGGSGAGAGTGQASQAVAAIAMASVLLGANPGLGADPGAVERSVEEIPLAASADPLARLRLPMGSPRSDIVAEGDTLLDIAFRNRVGFHALKQLNPELDVWLPRVGAVVELPTQLLLPDVELSGLVLNIPEMRLFDATAPAGLEVLAAAVGDPEDPTPVGSFTIQGKRTDPTWNVPVSIQQERPGLPEQVAPGPDNPLGSRWMRIGHTSYGIHGTNVRWSIGRLATHGCVRLYEEDIRELFDRTPEGTPLRIVYQPYKWGRRGSSLLFEAHPDLYERTPDRLAAALALPRELGILSGVDVDAVWRAVEQARGVPVSVGRIPPAAPPAPGG